MIKKIIIITKLGRNPTNNILYQHQPIAQLEMSPNQAYITFLTHFGQGG